MGRWLRGTLGGALAFGLALAAAPGVAQEREYHVAGSVIDAAKQPLSGAVVEMRERTNRRGYRTESGKDGRFRLVGLPRGIYDVTVSKPGYKARTAEWDLHEAQDRLRKVEFDPFVLLTEAQVGEIQRDTRMKEMLDQATKLMQRNDVDGTLAVVAKMLAENPDDANALYARGLCLAQKGQVAEAVASFERVTQLVPGFAAAHVQLAACYERRGDKERALTSYDAALKLEPDNAMALYNAGVIRYNAGHAAEALPYFENAARVRPDDVESLEMAGYCHLQAPNYGAALSYFERARALTTDPARGATLDGLLQELRPRVHATPSPGSGS